MLLSELINRNVRIEWHEAVALIRDVLDQTPDVPGQAPRVPGVHQVELLQSGRVALRGGFTAVDAVKGFAELLHLLLSDVEPPVQLRLLNGQSHASVSAYSEALAFFERPNRDLILQELCMRGMATPAVPTPEDIAALSDYPPEAPPEGEAAAERAHSSKRLSLNLARLAPVALAIGALVILAAAGVWFVKSGIGWGSGGGDNLLARGANSVASAVTSAVTVLDGHLAKRETSPPELVPVEAPEPLVAPVATRGLSGPRSPRSISSRPGTDRAAPLAGSAGNERLQQRSPISPARLDPVAPLPAAAGLQDAAGPPLPDFRVYTADSPDVAEPVAIRPQLPQTPRPSFGLPPAELRGIELLILPNGTVQSVRLVGRPRDVHDSMLLSAAKAWQFHPATRNGMPVSYRKTVWILR